MPENLCFQSEKGPPLLELPHVTLLLQAWNFDQKNGDIAMYKPIVSYIETSTKLGELILAVMVSVWADKGTVPFAGWSDHSMKLKPRGGGVLSPKSYMDVPAGPRKSDYLYTNFLPNFPPISIPYSKEKHPIWIKLGAFYNNLPKIHPIYVIWAPSSLMKTPPPRLLNQISQKSAPKGRHIYVYHVNVRTPRG